MRKLPSSPATRGLIVEIDMSVPELGCVAGTTAAATLAEDSDELAIEGGGEWWFNGTRTRLRTPVRRRTEPGLQGLKYHVFARRFSLCNWIGRSTVKTKTQFAASEGLGGVFFWEGGQDTADTSASLMAAARAAAEEAATRTAAGGSKADL